MLSIIILGGGIISLATFCLYKLFYQFDLGKRMPPGPGFHPIRTLHDFGPFGKKQPFKELISADSYGRFGKIFTLWIGPLRMVFINDVDIALEMLVTKGFDFSNRPHTATISLFTEENKDIAMSDANDTWKLHRKLTFQAFRNFMSGDRIETATFDVFEKMIDLLDKLCENKTVDSCVIENHISFMMYSLLAKITFNHEYGGGINDPEYVDTKFIFDSVNSIFSKGVFEDACPWLLPYYKSQTYKKCEKLMTDLTKIFQPYIDNHETTLKQESPRDILDFLLIAKSSAEKEKTYSGEITSIHVRQTMRDIFLAGTDTSRMTQQWVIFFMAYYPAVQEAVYNEIYKECKNSYPRLSQRSMLPYTDATFHEIMRRGTIAAFGAPHCATKDSILANYFIPKNTIIMTNFYACHHDANHWEEPLAFKPERFLINTGLNDDEMPQIAAKNRAFMPFSAGPRACLGQSVAKADNFLIFCLLVQRYEFCWPTNRARPDPDEFYKDFQAFGAPVDHVIEMRLRQTSCIF